ncbi:MAG: zinc-binding dehydrogenase [Planctomycetes bacterium]|nr:zinc-binding dehydrogenase [Planctomycetota bacterium]
MRAAVVESHGGPEQIRLATRELPQPGPGELRIRVRAAGLNHLDTWVRRGVPGHTFPLPLVLGSDGAGIVDAVGAGVRSARIGDEIVLLPGVSCGVCAACLAGEDPLCADYAILGEARDGTCADYVVVPAANVAPKPTNLSFAEAAAMPLVFQTAWSMLVRKAAVRPGETVLVHAGGSGVGSAAIQIAKLFGARVLATAGSAEKCARAIDLGADHAIDYRAEDFAKAVRRLTGGAGVDVVIEHVGAATFDGSLRALRRGGRLVTCGATTGGDVGISLHRVFFKNLSILGNTMGRKDDLLRVLQLADAGRLRPVLARTLPLAELREAHRLLEQRQVFGKLVVEP